MDKNLQIKISIDKKTGAIKVVESELNGLDNSVKKTTRSIKNQSKTTAKSIATFSLYNTQAIVATASLYAMSMAIAKTVSDFIELEKAQIGVKKTTGLMGRDFDLLTTEINAMAVSMSGFELNGLYATAEAAGQLGITGVNDITEFTRVMAMVGLTTELTSEQSAIGFAKLSNSLSEPVENIETLASVANELSNTTTANVDALLRFSQRLTGGAKTAGLVTDEIFGLSATMIDLAINFETGGTNINRVMLDLISDSGKFSKAMDKDFESFATTVRDKPIEALKGVLEHLSGLSKTDAANFLKDLGYSGTEVKDVLLKLSSNTELLTKNLKIAHDEYEDGTSIADEYKVVSEGLGAQNTKLAASMKLLGSDIGEYFKKPILQSSLAIQNLVKDMRVFLNPLGNMNLSDLKEDLSDLEDEKQEFGYKLWYNEKKKDHQAEIDFKKAQISLLENEIFLRERRAEIKVDEDIENDLLGFNSLGNPAGGNNSTPCDKACQEARTKARVKAFKEQLKLQTQLTSAIASVNPYDSLLDKYNNYVSTAKGNKANLLLIDKWYYQELGILNTKSIKEFEDAENTKVKKKLDLLSQATNIISPIDSINENYMSMYDVVQDVFSTNQMDTFFDKWNKNINAIYDKDTSKNSLKSINGQIDAYDTLANTISSMYEQGSTQAQTMQKIQSGIRVADQAARLIDLFNFMTVEGTKQQIFGTTALAASLAQPFPANLAAYATVSSMLLSLGIGVSGILGGGGTHVTEQYDALSSIEANKGTGTVLGDNSKSSESINSSLEILSDFAKPEFDLLSKINKSLLSIDSKIGGVANEILKKSGFELGNGFVSSSSTNSSYIDTTEGKFMVAGATLGFSAASDILESAIGKNFISDGVNGLANGVFGGKSTTTTNLHDSGLLFTKQTLIEALADIDSSSYQTTKTTTKTDGGWFHSDKTKIDYSTRTQDLDTSTERQFELILSNLYDITILSATSLNEATADVVSNLDVMTINLGKISLLGKTGDEIQENLSSVFGEIADNMAKEAFPMIIHFQQVGEGLYETLSRVSVGMQESSYYIGKLGNDFSEIKYSNIVNKTGDVAFESLSQSIVLYEDQLYSTANGIVSIVENMSGSAEDLYVTYDGLVDVRSQLQFLSKDYSVVTSNLLLGADGLDNLNSSLEDFFKNFLTEAEQLTYQTQDMSSEFNKLGLTLPSSAAEYKALVLGIDASTSSGQKLLGSVLSLSDAFSDLTEDSIDAITKINDAYLGEYSPLSMLQKTEYANMLSYSPETSGLSAVDSAYLALETVAKTATRDEDLTMAFNNYVDQLEKQAPDATQRDIVNELIETQTVMKKGLKKISDEILWMRKGA